MIKIFIADDILIYSLVCAAPPLFTLGYKLIKRDGKLATAKAGKSLGKLEGEIGMRISKKHVITSRKVHEGIVIIGPPGEYKTTGLFMNNLLDKDLMKSSRVITDLKGEIWDLTHKFRESLGEKCIRLDVLGKSSHYNPMDFCTTFDEIRRMANGLLQNATEDKDDEWINMSLPLFVAILLYAKKMGRPFDNLPWVYRYMNTSPIGDVISKLMETGDELIIDQYKAFEKSLMGKSGNTAGSILTTLCTKLALFSDPKLADNIRDSSFTPEELRRHVVDVYLTYDALKSDYLKQFVAIFYEQMIQKCAECYDSKTSLPVIFMLDEFQNSGKIQGFDTFVRFCRGYKICLVPCLQDISALNKIYGKDTALSILNGLKTKLILPSISDTAALEYISTIIGQSIVTTNDNGKEQTKTKPLYSPDEIRRLETGKVLIIAHNKQPIEDDLDIWFKNKKYGRNLNVTLSS